MRISSLHSVYTSGVVTFGEKVQKKDKYNAPIRGKFEIKPCRKEWFRQLGITAQDTYYASADQTQLSRKIAIRGDVVINPEWVAEIEGKKYTVYRVFYAYRHNETEISLSEVKA